MKVMNLSQNTTTYTCNVYFVLGAFNYLKNKNTLIDVGRDESIIELIDATPTGVGKRKIDQVILTHSHYDHSSLLPIIRKKYNPIVYAFSSHLKDVDVILKDGDVLRVGDEDFTIYHTPGHSSDSVCIYSEKEQILFSGDTDFMHLKNPSSHESVFLEGIKKLMNQHTKTIYPGHGNPYNYNLSEILSNFFHNTNL